VCIDVYTYTQMDIYIYTYRHTHIYIYKQSSFLIVLGVYEKSTNFQDSRVRTDTPGPGEAVFASRFNGNPHPNVIEHIKFQNPKNIETYKA
jgi:hypothetical protein